MHYKVYAHRFADVILNSDYELKKEIEEVVQGIDFNAVEERFEIENEKRKSQGKRLAVGKQSTINLMFRE